MPTIPVIHARNNTSSLFSLLFMVSCALAWRRLGKFHTNGIPRAQSTPISPGLSSVSCALTLQRLENCTLTASSEPNPHPFLPVRLPHHGDHFPQRFEVLQVCWPCCLYLNPLSLPPQGPAALINFRF